MDRAIEHRPADEREPTEQEWLDYLAELHGWRKDKTYDPWADIVIRREIEQGLAAARAKLT